MAQASVVAGFGIDKSMFVLCSSQTGAAVSVRTPLQKRVSKQNVLPALCGEWPSPATLPRLVEGESLWLGFSSAAGYFVHSALMYYKPQTQEAICRLGHYQLSFIVVTAISPLHCQVSTTPKSCSKSNPAAAAQLSWPWSMTA